MLTYGSCNCQVHVLSGFGARTYDGGDRDLAEEHQKEEKAVCSKTLLQIPLCTVIVVTFNKKEKKKVLMEVYFFNMT